MWAETRQQDNKLHDLLISIHSARVGGDASYNDFGHNEDTFQSTPPVWAETQQSLCGHTGDAFQSTPPVWAETFPTGWTDLDA